MPAFCSTCNQTFRGDVVPATHVASARHLSLSSRRAPPTRPPTSTTVPKNPGETFAFTILAPVGSTTLQEGRELINESNLPAVAAAAARFATSKITELSIEALASGGPNASGKLMARLVADSHDPSSQSDFELASNKLLVSAASTQALKVTYNGLEGTSSAFPTKQRLGLPGLAIDWCSTASVQITVVIRLTLQGSGRNDVLDAKRAVVPDEDEEIEYKAPTKSGYIEETNLYALVSRSNSAWRRGSNSLEECSDGSTWVATAHPNPAHTFEWASKTVNNVTIYIT